MTGKVISGNSSSTSLSLLLNLPVFLFHKSIVEYLNRKASHIMLDPNSRQRLFPIILLGFFKHVFPGSIPWALLLNPFTIIGKYKKIYWKVTCDPYNS